MHERSLKRCSLANLASPQLMYNGLYTHTHTHLYPHTQQHALRSWHRCMQEPRPRTLTQHVSVFFLPRAHTHEHTPPPSFPPRPLKSAFCLCVSMPRLTKYRSQMIKERKETGDRWSSYLQSFTFPIQTAAQALVVGCQHVQFRPQGIVGRGRSLGDEAVHTVSQEFDL